MAYISPVLTAIANAVKKASVPMMRDFNELEHLQNSLRNDGGFALHSRQKAEKILHEELAKFRSSYAVVMNQKDAIPASGNCFLVSAIDGYANFAHANASFAISVAMLENNVIVGAVVYSPIYDEMYFAEKGNGAFKEGFRNFERIRVATQKNVAGALICANADIKVVERVMSLTPNIALTGAVSLDLAHIAAGKADVAVWSSCSPAEIAAGILLVKEAGGYVYGLEDSDVRSENLQKTLFGGSVMATNEALRAKIAEAFAK